MVLSSLRIRRGLVARLGAGPFLGLYSLVAFAFFVPLVWTYFAHKHAGPLLWSIPIGTPLRWAIYVGHGGGVHPDGGRAGAAEPGQHRPRRPDARVGRNASPATPCSWASGSSASCI